MCDEPAEYRRPEGVVAEVLPHAGRRKRIGKLQRASQGCDLRPADCALDGVVRRGLQEMVRHAAGQRHGCLSGARAVAPADVQEQFAPGDTPVVVAQPRRGHELGQGILGQQVVGERRELAAAIVRGRTPVSEGAPPLPMTCGEVEEPGRVVEVPATGHRSSIEQGMGADFHDTDDVAQRAAVRRTDDSVPESPVPGLRQAAPCLLLLEDDQFARRHADGAADYEWARLLARGDAVDEEPQSVEPVDSTGCFRARIERSFRSLARATSRQTCPGDLSLFAANRRERHQSRYWSTVSNPRPCRCRKNRACRRFFTMTSPPCSAQEPGEPAPPQRRGEDQSARPFRAFGRETPCRSRR